jgi:adenylate cyclase
VQAAVHTHQALAEFHHEIEPDARLCINFGIHTGRAVVGNVGTAELMNFTAVGDTVNLAHRLQGIGKGSQIIISQAAHNLVKDHVVTHKLGPHKVKGREEPVVVYEVREIHP